MAQLESSPLFALPGGFMLLGGVLALWSALRRVESRSSLVEWGQGATTSANAERSPS